MLWFVWTVYHTMISLFLFVLEFVQYRRNEVFGDGLALCCALHVFLLVVLPLLVVVAPVLLCLFSAASERETVAPRKRRPTQQTGSTAHRTHRPTHRKHRPQHKRERRGLIESNRSCVARRLGCSPTCTHLPAARRLAHLLCVCTWQFERMGQTDGWSTHLRSK